MTSPLTEHGKETRMPTRCPWSEQDDPMRAYHDREWGVPVHDDRTLFEYMVLDAFQAGLSWAIILRKREAFRAAFAGFDPEAVARFGPDRVEELVADPGIVRNRRKIEATVSNAAAFLEVREELGSFDRWIWGFVDGRPVQNAWERQADVPATTAESEAMSGALKERGFLFVGPTICYAFMQAAGLVNDHLTGCFRYEAVRRLGAG